MANQSRLNTNWPSSRVLCDTLLAGGFAGGISCLTLHKIGGGDPSVPISIEYADGNPLAVTFVLSIVAMSAVSAALYWRIPNRTESVLMASATLCFGVIAATEHSSMAHSLALGLAVLSISLAPTVNAFRSDIGLGTIVRVAMTLASMLILAMTSVIPDSPISLGIAERIWFVVIYLNNAWNLNIVRQDQ